MNYRHYKALMEQWSNPNVHPDKVRGVENLGKTLGSSSFVVKAADEEYQKAVEYFKKYHPDIYEVSMQSVAPLAMSAGMLLLQAQEYEKNNIEYLEHLALQTVLELPEFTDAKAAYESGELDFDVELVNDDIQVELDSQNIEDSLEELDQDQIESLEDDLADALSFDEEEVRKRNFINLFIQGSAVEKLRLWEMLKTELSKIDEELPEIYGQLMSVAHLIYWYMPDMNMDMAAQGGVVEVDTEQDPFVIRARATIFPLLMHEIVKGLTEYVSMAGLPDSAKTAMRVSSQTDTKENEVLHIMLGRAAWSRLRQLLKTEEQRQLYSVWQKIATLPAIPEDMQEGFAYVVKQILENPNTSFVINTIRNYLQEIDNAINEYENYGNEWTDEESGDAYV